MVSVEVEEMLFKYLIFNLKFSKYCKQVYAIDIDETRLNICKNNCKVYECSDNIEFIKSDYLLMKNKIQVFVYLSTRGIMSSYPHHGEESSTKTQMSIQ